MMMVVVMVVVMMMMTVMMMIDCRDDDGLGIGFGKDRVELGRRIGVLGVE